MNDIKKILTTYFFAVLIILFVIPFSYQEFLTTRVSIDREIEALEEEGVYIESLIQIGKKLEPHSEILDEISRGFPVEPSTPSMIKHFESLVAGSGMLLSNLGPMTTTDVEGRSGLRQTSLELGVVGNSYEAMKNFIREIEGQGKLISINSASVSMAEEEEMTRFSLTLNITTYSY